jgi:UDP-N-acetylmuramoylalanine--D-glutamate ligase
VTGTNGKTTTTELARHLIEGCGHSVVLAGNNATPFSEAVLVEPPPGFIVLEVSSYQLETAREFRPWISAVLNVTADHLGRHGTKASYAAVKNRICAAQRAGDVAVLNADDPWTSRMEVPDGAARWTFSLATPQPRGLWLDGDVIRAGDEAVAAAGGIRLRGRHNLQNALAALTMMRAGGFDWPSALAALQTFTGAEHRIERVASVGGVAFYNDSKSTNVDSLRAALESFDRAVVLIAGGRGKGSDYRVLRELVRAKVKKLVTMGEDAARIEAAFEDLVPVERAATMEDAVRKAARPAGPGDVVLLSPACASFDMFDDFEHRGRTFKAAVSILAGESGEAL